MEVKGTAVIATVGFVRERFGQEALSRLIEKLPAASKQIWSGQLLASQWYPGEAALIQPMQAICRELFAGDTQGAREIGRHSADTALTGIYKVFVKLGSPAMTVDRGIKLYEQYYRPGEVGDSTREPNRIVRQIRGVTDRSGMLEQRLAGFVERALEMSGGRNSEVRVTKSPAAGHACMEFDCRWS